jgi:hypothetical protein
MRKDKKKRVNVFWRVTTILLYDVTLYNTYNMGTYDIWKLGKHAVRGEPQKSSPFTICHLEKSEGQRGEVE